MCREIVLLTDMGSAWMCREIVLLTDNGAVMDVSCNCTPY